MNGATPKSNKETPKTPGGISKSLLTPCRRVGLSRKWRKSGCSPFISPLTAQNTTPEGTRVAEDKNRKKCDENEHVIVNSQTASEYDNESNVCSPMSCNNSNKNNNITLTPCRNSQIQRKKSKILSLSLKNSQETEKGEADSEELTSNKVYNVKKSKTIEIQEIEDKAVGTGTHKEFKSTQVVTDDVNLIRTCTEENVTKLVRTESKGKKLSLKKPLSKTECKETITEQSKPKDSFETVKPKEKSPNNLTKECIVVIQNKILKSNQTSNVIKPLQDSDSETDVPLSVVKRKSIESVTRNTLDDEDFILKPSKKRIRNLSIKKHKTSYESNSTSQSSQEDTDKRTILVKKTYEKVIMPQKAKSTGSITQKDIDDLKARIEMKKKLLLAKAMSIDTEELRSLIKKWQKGCQDALMELLELMKKKLPDRQNMEYAEILQTLKIPAELVGYDSENDCFTTPDDTNVLLSAFKL